MSIQVTVPIPEGLGCRQDNRLCIFARYTKKWQAYNCTIHHKILKGQQEPRKCQECLDYCEQQTERRSAG